MSNIFSQKQTAQIISYVMLIGLLASSFSNRGYGQPLAPEAPFVGTWSAQEHEAAKAALREHLKKLRRVQVEYHMTETAAKDREFRAEHAKLVDEGRPIYARLLKQIIAKFAANPKEDPALPQLLMDIVEQNANDACFEGMAELGLLLQSNGFTTPKQPSHIALSAIATNQYALALAQTDAVMSSDQEPPKMLQLLGTVLDHFPALWEEELRYREEDAKGEPLPQVVLNTTKGAIVIELFEDRAPNTVANFIELVESGFYDGRLFHTVQEHFMAQTGDPEDDSTGGPGYMIRGEANREGARKFFRGSVGMALNKAEVNSAGSQFFFTFIPALNMNDTYTCFGRIVSGIEVLGNLTRIEPGKKREEEDPALPDEILEAKVLRKRNHPYVAEKTKL